MKFTGTPKGLPRLFERRPARPSTTDANTIAREYEYMSLFEPASPLWTARALAALRIAAGLIFLMAGTMKMFGFPPPPTFGPKLVLIPPMWELHLAAILEILGGVALLAGFLTRPVAFILSGEMAVAYWQVHNPVSPYPTTSGGMPAAILCFVFLYLSFAGAGAWSIDSMIARSRGGILP